MASPLSSRLSQPELAVIRPPPVAATPLPGRMTDGEISGSDIALAGEHGDQLGIPLRQHGRQLVLGPVLEVRRPGSVDRDLAIVVRRGDDIGTLGRFGGAGARPGPAAVIDDIDFAIKGVAEIVVALRGGDGEQQIAVFSDAAVGIGDADAVLAAGLPSLGGCPPWPRVSIRTVCGSLPRLRLASNSSALPSLA